MKFDKEYFLNSLREKDMQFDYLYQYFFGWVSGLIELEHVSAEERILRIREFISAVNEFEQEKIEELKEK